MDAERLRDLRERLESARERFEAEKDELYQAIRQRHQEVGSVRRVAREAGYSPGRISQICRESASTGS